MNTPQPLYEVLYVSTLAPSTPINAVADISRHARMANPARGVTGVLIFDGMRFAQQLEGSKKQTMSLIEKIRNDTRHTNIEILYHGDLAERRFRSFAMGYSAVDDVDALAALEQLYGVAAVQALLKLATHIDLAP